jgi:hypothetical protein
LGGQDQVRPVSGGVGGLAARDRGLLLGGHAPSLGRTPRSDKPFCEWRIHPNME